jgi:hypothetical protein
MNVMPSSCVVMFGNLEVPVTLKAGVIKNIDAGSISFKGLPINSRSIVNAKTRQRNHHGVCNRFERDIATWQICSDPR